MLNKNFYTSSAIGDGEKAEIRRNILQSFGSEPVYQIALQAAVSIGKIARYDVPKDWPELLPALVQAVQAEDALIQHRALLVLHHVIKALASKRYDERRTETIHLVYITLVQFSLYSLIQM